MCYCEFDVDPESDDENTPETAWHFRRTCVACGEIWYSLACPHENKTKKCPACGTTQPILPDPEDEE